MAERVLEADWRMEMFEDNQVSCYRSIKAPAELKARIISNNNNKKSINGNLIRIVSIVAMLMLVVGASAHLLRLSWQQVILVEGQEINSEGIIFTGVDAAAFRELSVKVPMDFKVKGQITSISVSCGKLFVDNEIEGQSSIELTQDMRLWWSIDTVGNLPACEMYVSSKNGNYTIIINKDKNGNLIIQKNN